MRYLGAALLLLLAAGSQPVAAEPERQPVTVTKVTDGDTVQVQSADGRKTTVRLIGIDTPETVDPDEPVQCYGPEASARATQLLGGQTVDLELDPSQGVRDYYGRTLAYLWLTDGRNYGETMIADGYAHEYTYRLPYAYQAEFKAAQDEARANQAGLWAPETCGGKP